MSGAMAGMPSGPTLAMVWAAMMSARMPQRLVTGGAGARGLRGAERGPRRASSASTALKIVLGVHAHRGLVGLDHADGDPVLEQAQLLELLGALEG